MNQESRTHEKGMSIEATIEASELSPTSMSAEYAYNPAFGLTQTILVVEDDAFTRKAICDALECAGYHVLAAARAAEAKQIHGRGSDVVNLLLTDIVLPGTNGRALARALVHSAPALRVLLMSGYVQELRSRHGADLGSQYFWQCIEKPFSVSLLLRTLSQILSHETHVR